MTNFKILNTLVVLTGLLCSFYCRAQVDNCDLPAIDRELEKREDKEQSVRMEVIPVVLEYKKTGDGLFKLMRLVHKMNKIDKKNQKYLDELFSECGWDENLSDASHSAIFLIIDHGDIEFINKYIHMVKEKAEAGILDPGDYPTVLDRKLMYEGKPQLFGTQTFSVSDSSDENNYVWPVAMPEKLSHRRDSVSLPPMSEYFKIAMDEMGIKMVWDESITIEQALEMNRD
ncbi:hypothetical protein SAMN05661096_00064 [Marivirga sericea]|uniref:Copper amine oxidase N-terminal domain-containing protein n=1 Tax=Marivirga sericea TaxID=1028 RepID=A0A1X7I1N8_9BACT|nr:DUF6624 domain-containing protein [Marivirga sericea]SMG07697.1 hypothetical protein SAMN05661096_00064 [Marivirga sericea]